MKDIESILKDAGVESAKIESIVAEVNKNYRTVTDYEKQVKKEERAVSERDSWKERAETAEETLKGFEGKDFDTITKERDDWKKKAEDAEKNFTAKEAEREKQELLKEAFADVEFTSNSAKTTIMKQISDSVTVKNGKLIGFKDLLDEARKTDASAFVNKEQEELEQNKAKFTDKMSNQNKSGTVTKEQIMSIKDRTERRQAMLDNKGLFGMS